MSAGTEAIDRLPPQNVEAEQAVIGACLVDPDAAVLVRAILDPADCYRTRHAQILAAIYTISDSHSPVDWTTLADQLKRDGTWEDVGGVAYLSECCAVLPTSAHVEHYAGIVKRTAFKRRLVSASARIARIAYDDATDPIADRAACLKAINDVEVGGERYPVFTPEEQAAELAESTCELAMKGETGIMSGFYDLDNLTGGFEPGQFITLLAVTSLGKSAFALSMARQMAGAKKPVPVLFCSAEMTRSQLEWRHAAAICGVSSKELRARVAKGVEKAATTAALIHAQEVMGKGGLHLWYKPDMTTADIRSRVLEWKLKAGIRVVIVDYLQILTMEKAESKRVQISNACHALKAIAGEAEVPVIALCQVNRESVKGRENKRPSLMDASESGSIEQDSDILLGLYRDDFFYQPYAWIDEKAQRQCIPGVAELLVLKQRDGPTATVPLAWKPTTAEYLNRTEQQEDGR